jgi:UDP-2,4-diacetamido-2,4,6-trideoxy-beta-L-altropyranose hydrolase
MRSGATNLPETTFRPVSLRRATLADARRIWLWRNEPAARSASFSTGEVPWDVHQRWFAGRVDSPTTHLWIASDPSGRELGYARFDLSERIAEISVALDASTRGEGWGRAVIRAACERELESGAVDRVIAHVKLENDASLAAFRAAGFAVETKAPHGESEAWALSFAPDARAQA